MKSPFKRLAGCERLRDVEHDDVWYRFLTLNRGNCCSSVSSARKLKPSGKLTQWVLTSSFLFGYSAGLKSPTVTSHNMAKTASQSTTKTAPSANQLAKQAFQYPLQRSGSARFSRVHSAGKDVWALAVLLLAACVRCSAKVLVCEGLCGCQCCALMPQISSVCTMASIQFYHVRFVKFDMCGRVLDGVKHLRLFTCQLVFLRWFGRVTHRA